MTMTAGDLSATLLQVAFQSGYGYFSSPGWFLSFLFFVSPLILSDEPRGNHPTLFNYTRAITGEKHVLGTRI
jgi:hypothetical protein